MVYYLLSPMFVAVDFGYDALSFAPRSHAHVKVDEAQNRQ
jgi:hypothetical protein